ncbi:hypothetical protein SNEBB_000733 [Seison nebaliae]|nr:hypothetical protein SNEBB_000733 [Seison nebaliae]
MMYSHLSILIFLLYCINQNESFFVTLDANGEECFFERVEQNVKLSLNFEVVEGGFLDIDVKITGPEKNVVYEGQREPSGRYMFTSKTSGVHNFCFSNKMSTMTPKIVMFDISVGDGLIESKKALEGENPGNITDHQEKLISMVADLSNQMRTVKHENEYMEIRERLHRMVNENTNRRVVLWSVLEAILLFCMAIGQVYYLKRYFEIRRVV